MVFQTCQKSIKTELTEKPIDKWWNSQSGRQTLQTEDRRIYSYTQSWQTYLTDGVFGEDSLSSTMEATQLQADVLHLGNRRPPSFGYSYFKKQHKSCAAQSNVSISVCWPLDLCATMCVCLSVFLEFLSVHKDYLFYLFFRLEAGCSHGFFYVCLSVFPTPTICLIVCAC